jgi:hypothetical protein
VRHIGVDLHKTNFVVCFLNEDDTSSAGNFSAFKAGIAFHRAVEKDDAVGGRSDAEHLLFLRPNQSLRRARRAG